MSYRIARSLDTLRTQINEAYPNRSKLSDGWIGDPAHSSRSSDHNPDPSGIVRALDITHDLDDGCDCNDITAALVASRDARIKYIIWNKRIVSGAAGPSPWTWRTYTGSNPHDKHLHLSVVGDSRADSTKEWDIGKDWFGMATKAELREVVKAQIDKATAELKKEIAENRKLLAVGKTQKTYNPDNINLKKLGGG